MRMNQKQMQNVVIQEEKHRRVRCAGSQVKSLYQGDGSDQVHPRTL